MSIIQYNISNDLWYQYFQGKTYILILMYGFRSIIALISIIFNLSIVYVTIKNKSLKSSCNILIALESFFGVFYVPSYFISFILSLFNHPFIKYIPCFWLQIIPILTGNNAQITMILTGFDRFYAVKLPIWYVMYKKRNKNNYMLTIIIILILYAGFQLFLYLNTLADTDGETLINCSSYDIGRGSWTIFMYSCGIVLSVTLMITYILIWYLVLFRKSSGNVINQSKRRIIKSLSIIIILNLIGVFINSSLKQLYNFITVDVIIKNFITFINSHMNIIVYSSNAPVLYFFSEKYRKAFNESFPFLLKLNIRSTQIAPAFRVIVTNVSAGPNLQNNIN
ncbi:hypothetical protein Mgra_00004233 [Meloidogyne graminicola]|uniref:G-protein coupled receptors family 1 profile domain-containing protein n=1 Tax=Meloidogyne graminicola TaxID=189291 RepID=A0A8S9ZSL9_9BILA|nr:hypothetical protein Mgra_00004233 [Meloidogyne graminicola]